MEESKHTVLITTSGTGCRLGNITHYTNKSLVKIGKKPAISYIIERYPENTEFVVTIGYYGDHVRQFLTLVYPNRNIQFCEVDKFKGDGSSLLYSMNCAKDYLQKPFILHVCDSIILDTFRDYDGNWCESSDSKYIENYRTHNVSNGELSIINEKGVVGAKYCHSGVVKISDYKDFWDEVKYLLDNSGDDCSLSDCHAINGMLKRGKKFKIVKVNDWLDIGNIRSLQETRQHIPDKFEILDKDGESIFIFDDRFVVKFFYDKNHVQNRVSRLKYLKGFGPKLINQSDNFYVYEFIKGVEASHFVENEKFERLITTTYNKYWSVISETDEFFEKTKEFYFDKTIERATRFLKSNNISDEPVVINGEYVDKFSVLMSKIPKDVLCTRKKYHYHGDFVLDNIIINEDEIKFIDWRQDFCGDTDGGDMYYDLSKLNHSLMVNHELIYKNLFTFKEIENQPIKTIEIEILRRYSHVKFEKILHQFIKDKNLDMDKVNLLTALIWINMSPLHHHPFDHFLYYFGLYNLNQQTKYNICSIHSAPSLQRQSPTKH